MKQEAPHVIVHYHLRPGGVTQVISGLCRGLKERSIPTLVLSGGEPSSPSSTPTTIIPELDYGPDQYPQLAEVLKEAVAAQFGDAIPVWHFQNPCLGKNPSLTRAANQLAADGHAIILHHHDFAEDGRPDNYQRIIDLPSLYPGSPRIAHACINHRDQRALLHAGLPLTQSAVLPNPIALPEIHHKKPSWIFQPVRGIRRKNLGETLLLAAHSPHGTRFAISQRPDQTHSTAIHDAWADLAAELKLPVEFAVTDRLAPIPGADASFASWMTTSTHLLSTSVSEGFGMTFLEASTLGIPLIGRRLPELDEDLSSLGLSGLYQKLLVPCDAIDVANLNRRRAEAIQSQYASFRRTSPPPSELILPEDTHIDFGMLPEDIQADIIRGTCSSPLAILVECNGARIPLTTYLLERIHTDELLEPNLKRFEIKSVVQDLCRLRQRVIDAPHAAPTQLDRHKILDQFISPSRFRFLSQ